MKKVAWVGNSLEEMHDLPKAIRKAVGFQIHLLQEGVEPDDFKPMPSVGSGVYEIRVRNEHGQNTGRCFYVVKFKESVFILHAFEKKQQKTPKANLEKGQERYKELLNYVRSKQ